MKLIGSIVVMLAWSTSVTMQCQYFGNALSNGPNFPFAYDLLQKSDQIGKTKFNDRFVTASNAQFSQLCDLKERVKNARYPRIGQAWSRADNLSEDAQKTTARHDLYFSGAETFGLKWLSDSDGKQTAKLDVHSIKVAKEKRAKLLNENSNMVILSEIRYHDAEPALFPKNSPFWKHEKSGEQIQIQDYKEYDKTDYSNLAFQEHVAAQARAAVASGAVDGVMLDWWHEGNSDLDKHIKLKLLKKVRSAVGPNALIMINTNEFEMSKETTGLVNGYYMECAKTRNALAPQAAHDEWKQILDTLKYSEKYARAPHINMLETWWNTDSAEKRGQLDKMRATTTLVLTQSDGFALFADPDNNGTTSDHQHDWYPFWNAEIGIPLEAGHEQVDGSFVREFENGTVLSNAIGDKSVTIKFDRRMQRVSNQEVLPAGKETSVDAHDGEIFLKVKK